MPSKLAGGSCTAISLVLLVLLSTISGVPVSAETLSNGTTSVANAGSSPSVEVSNATINDSTQSQIQLAYNATGEISNGDISLLVDGPGYYASANSTQKFRVNTTIDSSEGVVNLTIPQGTFGGGNHTLSASLINESTNRVIATDTNRVEATTPIVLSEYSVSNTTVYPEENVTVSTVLNNTADTSQNFTVAVYSGSASLAYRTVSVSAGSERTVELNVSFGQPGTYNISVNDEAKTEITGEDPLSVTETTVSNTSTFTYQNVTINSTVVNEGETTVERSITLYRNGFFADKRYIKLNPGESKNLSFRTYLSYPDSFHFRVGDGEAKTVTAERNPVEVKDTSVNKSTVPRRGTVQANVTLENTASEQVDRIVELNNGRRTVDTNTVSPAGGDLVTTTFNRTFDIGGVHALSGDSFEGHQKITVSDSDVVVEDYSVSSTTVYTRDDVTLSVTVNNTASEGRAFRLSVWSNKSGYQTGEVIKLDAGQEKQVTLSTSFYDAGQHNITVNNQPETTVTVKEGISVKNVSVSEQTLEKNETFQVNVTLDNPTSSDRSKYVNVWTGESQSRQVAVAAGTTKTVSFDVNYREPGRHTIFAEGQRKTVAVLNDTDGTANISIAKTFGPYEVVNNSTGYFYAEAVNTGNASGVQNVTLTIDGTVVDSRLVYVEPNSTAPVFFQHKFTEKGEYSGYINGSDSQKVNITVRGPVVVDSSVSIEHVNGTEPSELPTVEPLFSGNSVSVKITASEYNRDLSDIGADNSTVFQINFTVQNYTPRVMASTGQNLTWTTSPAGENRTNVSIKVSPAQLDYKTDFEGDYPSSPSEWDSSVKNDTANFGYDAAILMLVGDAQGDFFEASPSDLNGMTISTDAQLFDMPRYYAGSGSEEPRLEIGLAAPHRTVDGEVNQGRYRAFLPDSLLESWNVSDPESELTAGYSASDANITVTEVEGGAYVSLSLHYSSGTVTVSKEVTDSTTSDSDSSTTSDSTTSDTDDSSSTDSVTTESSSKDSVSTETQTETATEKATETATETETQTQTETQTPEATQTETEKRTETVTETGTTVSEEDPVGTETSAPGFGPVLTLVALIAASLLAVRRD